MTSPTTRERVAKALEGLTFEFVEARDGMTTLTVGRAVLRELFTRLSERAGFDQNTLVTAVDHFPTEPRFEVVWQFLSYDHNDRVRLKCRVAGDDANVPTCTPQWPGANFSERECFDMFGIRFDGHPDLRRLLMPTGYTHHPLRKDFPHAGIEPDRLYREWDKQRREGWQPDA
ncbi:MAG: NADH-quinone oxidoreductase subunit C [Planctomycetes bacterium]|nr:NADH-quinone oxidoreductase subunit C [Planctomycetota bacterium]